jgi:adenosylcobinamide-GDP ribazoletransferase
MLRRLIADTLSSIVFLSRLPLADHGQQSLPDFQATVHTYALAGTVIALPAAILLFLATMTGLQAPIVSALAVSVLVLTTGALHEDGLADTIDGFWGGQTRQRKLDIMRDSTIGTYGVLALVLTILMRVFLLSVLIDTLGGAKAAIILLACAGLSRAAMLQPWALLPAARHAADETGELGPKSEPGLSTRYGAPDRQTLSWGLAASAPALGLLVLAGGVSGAIVGLMLFQLATFLMIKLSRHHIQGHTGDTLGATQQLSELGLLLGLVWTM